MKKYLLIIALLTLGVLLNGCAQEKKPAEEEKKDLVVVGFVQVGAESGWRDANTESMRNTFTEENGYELIVANGQQQQANQITAIRRFIHQEVDYIVLAPVVEKGWETVLMEAQEAGIPVIIMDRKLNVRASNLYAGWVGSAFDLEADKLTAWMNMYFHLEGIKPADVHIVSIQGNLGSSAQLGRTGGLENACRKYKWELLKETPADFTQAKAREVMTQYLQDFPNLNVVYCENDNEALGAIEAIEASGRKPGMNMRAGEILVVSFDGVNKSALKYAKQGKIACIGECNAEHGPRVRELIETLQQGKSIPKHTYVDEALFTAYRKIGSVYVHSTLYPVSILE